MNQFIFSREPCCSYLEVVPFGYETHISDSVRRLLRFIRTPTSKYIKYAPDYFVIDKRCPDKVYLLEFKATRTPLYSENRINNIRKSAGDRTICWSNIGQMEELAHENYISLTKLNVRVVILNYCAYYEMPLLCDNVNKFKIIYKDSLKSRRGTGSGTPWVNFDTRSVMTFQDFLCQEHCFSNSEIAKLVSDAIDELNRELPVSHHPDSPRKNC
jgi:hypothetical protein